MDSLAALRYQLATANANLTVRRFGNVRPMKQLAEAVVQKFGAGKAPTSEAILNAVSRFIATGKLKDFRTLKLVCYGVTNRPRSATSTVLENDVLLTKLLAAIEALKHRTRQFRRCCQGLLSVFFSFNPYKTESRAGVGGWSKIRMFLAEHLRHLLSGERQPDWIVALREHEHVLSKTPGDKYGKEFLQGRSEQFDAMCSSLNVDKNSWIRENVVLAAIHAAAALPEAQFRSHIDFLLNSLRKAPNVRPVGVRRLLDHYATLKSTAEHIGLRTNALELMDNPLLVANAQRWKDASEGAKTMVGDWLKLKVIEQFFGLLSHDGVTDKRRVNFWSSYVPIIENIWIVFGTAAQNSQNRDFDNLSTLLGDHALWLEGATRTNNAFIMKIGSKYIIEFGETGNAAYIYNEHDLPFALSGALHLRNDLKQGDHSIPHVDRSHMTWEDKFRLELRLPTSIQGRSLHHQEPRPTFSSGTSARTARTDDFGRALRAFCAERGLRLQDNSARGGALIVYADSLNSKVSGTLGQWGFRYDPSNVRWVKASQ